MALINCDFFSDALGVSTSMTVILPQKTVGQIGMSGEIRAEVSPPSGHPTLYLLHGLSDDHTIWLRRTSIERYVAERGIAVVMPQVGRSFYTDEVYGQRYWTFLSEELPEIAGSFFPLSTRREDTFVAGLSMGGYGALKWALRHPAKFAAAAGLSGALDLVRLQAEREDLDDPRMMDRIFDGNSVEGTDDDLFALLDQPVDGLPQLYLACGTEDALYADNVRFRNACVRQEVPVTVNFRQGQHEWGFWDAEILRVLEWLPIG